jgi:hypothetical protein
MSIEPRRRQPGLGHFSAIPVILILATACGCGSSAASRAVSRVTLAQTMTYEQQVVARMEAERRFYKAASTQIGEADVRANILGDRGAISQACIDLDALLSESNGEMTRAALASWASSLNEKLVTSRAQSDQLLDAELEALELRMNELAKVRKALVLLQAEPGQWDRVQEFIKFGQDTKKKLDELNKKGGS